ncbi:MAG: hypothetical protein KIT48_12110 [Pseudolabrys sp.]|nr:hypothetical protein [Pseudolabrys sp.]
MDHKSSLSTIRELKKFPNIVEILAPHGGLGSKVDDILNWRARRGIDGRRGTLRRGDTQYFLRWCFSERSDAESFKRKFKGKSALARE